MMFLPAYNLRKSCNNELNYYITSDDSLSCNYNCFRYGNEHPHFFIGSLEDAVKEVVISLEDPYKVSLVNLYHIALVIRCVVRWKTLTDKNKYLVNQSSKYIGKF